MGAAYKATRDNVKIMGRTLVHEDALYLSYSAGYIEFETETDYAAVEILSNPEEFEETLRGVVAIFLNDSKEPVVRRMLHCKKQTIVFFESDSAQKIKVRIQKLSEGFFGTIGIRQILVGNDGNGKNSMIVPTPYKERKIEIIGDSISCGYGVEGDETHVFNTWEENPVKAYSVMAAELLDADYQLVTRSGIGMISCYVPPEVEEPDETLLMKQLYPRQDTMLYELSGWEEAGAPCDFTAFTPDTIVLNIGTNDASYCREVSERQQYFGKAYYEFCEMVLASNPEARLVCTLGLMDQRLCRIVEAQVRKLCKEYPDRDVSFFWTDIQKDEDGVGTDCHPSLITQKKMAELLASYLGYGKRVNEYSDGTT